MQNAITQERSLQYVEAVQVLILKKGYLWSCTKQREHPCLPTGCLKGHLVERHLGWNGGKQRSFVTNGHC